MLDWIWIIVFLIAILSEVMTSGNLMPLWFAVGALGAMLVQWADGGFVQQFFTFVGVSVLTMLIIRPMAAAYINKGAISTLANMMIGRQGIMEVGSTETMWGKININGITYDAIGLDRRPIVIGEQVEVIAADGTRFYVRKAASVGK